MFSFVCLSYCSYLYNSSLVLYSNSSCSRYTPPMLLISAIQFCPLPLFRLCYFIRFTISKQSNEYDLKSILIGNYNECLYFSNNNSLNYFICFTWGLDAHIYNYIHMFATSKVWIFLRKKKNKKTRNLF